MSNQKETTGARYYQGTIANNYAIQVNLNLSTNFINGQYHYDNSDEVLLMYGDVVNGLVQLKGKNPSDDKIAGFFKGSIAADGSILGLWNKADKTKEFPFELQRSETYITTNSAVVKGLSQRLLEIFHQEIKTNYFDIPDANTKLASEVLGKAYRLTDSLNQKKIAPDYDSGPYGISSEDQYPFLRELMQNDNETYTRKLWSYSFWMRRKHEGNLEIVASPPKRDTGALSIDLKKLKWSYEYPSRENKRK